MSARPVVDLDRAKLVPLVVKAAASVRKGFPVKLDSAGIIIEAAAVTDNAIGLAQDAGAAGATVRVALWGAGVVYGLVGTGDAALGAPLKFVSNGLTTATVGGGSVKQVICGQALEAGVAADLIAVNLGGFSWSCSA